MFLERYVTGEKALILKKNNFLLSFNFLLFVNRNAVLQRKSAEIATYSLKAADKKGRKGYWTASGNVKMV
jgi:hypothetical protein